MKKLILTAYALVVLFSAEAQQTVAICKEKYGCDIAKINLSRVEIDKVLGKTNFLVKAGKNAILVLNNCNSSIEEKRTIQQLHTSYGGKAASKEIKQFDLKKYIKDKGCLAAPCPNTTKKISFKLTSPEHSGTGYFFANLKNGEAYMPNAAFQQFYAGAEGFAGVKVDAFFRNYKYVSYMVDPEGKKFKSDMPIGTNMAAIGNDATNLEKFKKEFKATGKKRAHLNTADFQYEYVGKDDEGAALTFWLGPAGNVCLPQGKFDAWGFWNLGYIAVDGKTYLVAEISGSGFKVQVTGVSEGSYSFNPVGYQSIAMPNIKR